MVGTLFLTMMALGIVVSQAQAAVVGSDDRQEVQAHAYPWSAIGRLSKGDGSLCSGVLIGPRQVLTVAHCLWDDLGNNWVRSESLFFSAGVSVRGTVGVSGVTHYAVAGDYGGRPDLRLENVAHDWALLELREPLGERAGYLGLYPLSYETYGALAAEQPVIMHAGYSLPNRNSLRGEVGCSLLGWARKGVLAHSCDASAGDSGSPLFALIDGTPRVVALHASTFVDPISGGEPLSAAVPIGDVISSLSPTLRPSDGVMGHEEGWDPGLWRALVAVGVMVNPDPPRARAALPPPAAPTPASEGHKDDQSLPPPISLLPPEGFSDP